MSNPKSVQVALRIRPLVLSEISKGCKNVLDVYQNISQVRIQNTDKAFTYNYVFGPDSTQEELYSTCIKQLLTNIFQGYNLTILAYGQTGSGKTHSMGTTYSGDAPETMGVIPKSVKAIFDYISDNFGLDFTITVSFMELYQETLYDLLSDKPKDQCVLEIREDTRGIHTPGLTEVPVTSASEVFEALIRGSGGRATAATNMNAQSSRSHAIFTINLCIQNKANPCENKTSKLHFVDLAGSERPKKTGAVGTTFKEGININKGLLVLGNVISALGDEKQQNSFVPYRDSNLTRLLKDSLGGNSITLMIACVSPADYNLDETISTMRYADRAKKIQNKPIVNQNAKTAEINELKKTIQQLRLQIIGQGDPEICPAELELLRKENGELHVKLRDLTLQLSSSLHANTGLLEKVMILQNAIEGLQEKLKKLKSDCDTTFHELSVGIDNNDTEFIKRNLENLGKIREQFVDIDNQQKITEREIFKHYCASDYTVEVNTGSPEMIKTQETYTTQQIAFTKELQEITKQLSLKEHLARQIATNTHHMVDYTAMAENEAKIVNLQKEKDELKQQLKNMQGGKMAEQRRKRVQELEGLIHDLNKKIQEQARMIKLKEKDEIRIKTLNAEILQMKQMRVNLLRKAKEESEKFRAFKMEREREVAKLKQEDRKKQNKIVKMEVMHNKQQNVLKRKVEEAVALNKRLKDSLALRKATQNVKTSGKSEKIGSWVKQEIEIFTNLIEAEVTLTVLIEDRATLQEQLDKLRSSNSDEFSELISSLEEDIEMRSVQIADIQQKLLDSDENAGKSRFDNIQAMSDAKFALKTVMEELGEMKKKQVISQMKGFETQANYTELNNKIVYLEKMMKAMEYKHKDDLSKIQDEYEEKVTVLLRQLRGVEMKGSDPELKKQCEIQLEKFEQLDKSNQGLLEQVYEYQKQNIDLKEKLENITQLAKDNGIKEEIEEVVHDKTFITPTTVKVHREVDATFVKETENESDLSFIDDVGKDPDWQRTPVGKWILEKKRRTMGPTEVSQRLTFKRSSNGGCMCQKGNCSKRCGCKRFKKSCGLSCKCDREACSNRENDEEDLKENKSNNVLMDITSP